MSIKSFINDSIITLSDINIDNNSNCNTDNNAFVLLPDKIRKKKKRKFQK